MIDRADQLSITLQCDLLGINRSSFYYLPIPESKENLTIMQKLDEQYIKTPFWGTKKLLILLIALGYRINIKRLTPA